MEETAPPAEDLVSKYKRLLSMAKASLETNQKSLADKDAQISQQKLIIERLERERLANPSTNGSRADETSSGGGTGHTPRNILRRVDVNGAIWILVQYDSNVDTWVSLSSEQDLDDFMRRVPGSSLVKPHRCFTPAESQQLEAETKFKIDRVVEEFRRYKVKSEIARKQSSDDTRSRPSSSATHARSDDAETDEESHRYRQENARLQSELGSLESKWKLAYEKVIRENESLRHSGGEAMLAAQWRERFENTSREKMHLLDKLRIYESSGSKAGGTKSIEEAYNELKDEHKELQRRMNAVDKRRMNDGYGDTLSHLPMNSLEGTKLEYLKHMLLQYLTCRDLEVKTHMETAMAGIFRYNEKERLAIEDRRNAASQDALSSITSFLGGGSPK